VRHFRNHGSSSDHRTISDVNSVQHLAASANPDVLADGDSLFRRRLDVHRAIRSRKTVIGWNDDRVPTNCKTSMSVEDTVRADVSVRPYLDNAAIRGNDGAVGDGDPFRDQNAPPEHAPIGVDLDHRASGNVGGASDLEP
jgi:hypothetical protein